SVTSHVETSVLPPNLSTSDAATRTCSSRRPVGTTCAPAWARPRVNAKPMPDVPPITTAVLPFRSKRGWPILRPCVQFHYVSYQTTCRHSGQLSSFQSVHF